MYVYIYRERERYGGAARRTPSRACGRRGGTVGRPARVRMTDD